METAIITAVATILATTITATVGYLTQQRAARAAAAAQNQTTHADLVREAGLAARRVYEGAINRLETEQAEDRAEIDALKARIRHLEPLEGEVARLRRSLDETRAELETAKVALRIAYPDDPEDDDDPLP